MLVADRLPADALGLLIGPPGIGKSFVGLSSAISVATGRPWFGSPVVRSGPVAWVLAEGAPARFARRLAAAKLYAGLPLDQSVGIYTWPAPPTLLRESDVTALVEAVASTGAVLVVIDTYSRCAAGADENSAADTSRLVAALDALRGPTGATVLALHHTPHDGRSTPRGSSALLGAVDTVLTLTAADGRLRLACAKQRDGAPFAPALLSLEPIGDSVVPVLAPTEDLGAVVVDDAVDADILRALAGGPTSGSGLARSLGRDRSLVFARLRHLAATGHVHQTGAGPALRWRLS
jgi:hypothetical protein